MNIQDLRNLQEGLCQFIEPFGSRNSPPPFSVLAVDLSFGSGISSDEGLNQYRRNYVYGMIGNLQLKFPTLLQKWGALLFSDYTGRYLQSGVQTGIPLFQLGQCFPEFLRKEGTDKEILAAAAIDWLQYRSYYCEDIEPAGAVEIARFFRRTNSSDTLAVIPSLFFLSLEDIHHIIWKSDYTVQMREVDPSTYRLLELLKYPQTFDTIASELDSQILISTEFAKMLSQAAEFGWLKVAEILDGMT